MTHRLTYKATWNRHTGAYFCGSSISGKSGSDHGAVSISAALVKAGAPDGRLVVRDPDGADCCVVGSIVRVGALATSQRRDA